LRIAEFGDKRSSIAQAQGTKARRPGGDNFQRHPGIPGTKGQRVLADARERDYLTRFQAENRNRRGILEATELHLVVTRVSYGEFRNAPYIQSLPEPIKRWALRRTSSGPARPGSYAGRVAKSTSVLTRQPASARLTVASMSSSSRRSSRPHRSSSLQRPTESAFLRTCSRRRSALTPKVAGNLPVPKKRQHAQQGQSCGPRISV
jgi:hypothetical protein